MYNQVGGNNLQMFQNYSANEVRSVYKSSRLRPRTSDELELEVPLSIAASKGALWLRAILPAKYPYQAPIFQIIKAKVVHTHLDD